jgi:hypothetical protein
MGNFYSPPKREGNSPFTRTGLPPVKLNQTSDHPNHRYSDPMSLELHMADERVRTAGLSDAERQWRRKWVKDQHLHPDEPIHVDAVHRQLNPIRILYRWPWDKLYIHFLRPTFGVFYGTMIRQGVPKFLMVFVGLQGLYYMYKYEGKDWERLKGMDSYTVPRVIDKEAEIKEKHPGVWERGFDDPTKSRFLHRSFDKRTAYLDLGPPSRPW